MARKIFIDTNILVDFYQAAGERLKVFEKLYEYRGSLTFTSHSLDEFERNREKTLAWLLREFEKSMKGFQPFTTSIIQEAPEFTELIAARDEAQSKGKELAARLRAWIGTPDMDPVRSEFLRLYNDTAVQTLHVTPDLIDKARTRKLLGNPPVSPDKWTIGDELTWETLLTLQATDLIVVSKDGTFHTYEGMLKAEFHQATGHQVNMTKKVSDALRLLKIEPAPVLVEAEDKLEPAPADAHPLAPPGWAVSSTSGFTAMATDGRRGGFVPMSDHPNLSSYQCPSCGNYGPWNGAQCQSCGNKSDGD